MVNRLAFPVGRRRGFDPRHPASVKCRFSVTNTGTAAGNVLNGKPGAVTNHAQIMDGSIGPAQISTTSGGAQCLYTFSGGPTAAETQITFACILRAGAALFNATILANGEVGAFNAGAYFHCNNLDWSIQVPPTGAGSGDFTLTQGLPYFLGGSIDHAGNYTTITMRMDTGQIVSTTSGNAGSGISSTATTGHFYVGSFENAGNGFLGSIGAAMYSGTFLSLAQWRKWAADPWAFWYPRREQPFIGVTAPLFQPAWAARSSLVIGGQPS